MNIHEEYHQHVQIGCKFSVLIANAHAIYRECICMLLNPHFRIVGDAGDGLTAIKLAERLKPDVVVVDMVMPKLNGLEVIRQIRQFAPHTKALVLSEEDDEVHIARAVDHGARGYVSKDTKSDDLIKAIHAVALGRGYFTVPVYEGRTKTHSVETHVGCGNSSDMLTTREREVLQLVGQGLTSKQIGNRFSISPRTVEVHRANVMRKLNLGTTSELIRYAIQQE